MHEYPVTVQIVDIASETARKNKGRVRRIDLVVGEDSGFIGESIQMYFDVVAEGTLCEGAKLVIEGVKPQLRCDLTIAENCLSGNAFPFSVRFAVETEARRKLGKNST